MIAVLVFLTPKGDRSMTTFSLSRHAVLVCSALATLVGCGGSPVAGIALPTNDIANVLPYHHTFEYTGGEQSFHVPAGVKSITVVALGAAGDGASTSYSGPHDYFGRGGRVYAVIPVKPGETLYVFVGGRGAGSYSGGNGFNGGGRGGLYPACRQGNCYGYGGGGASDVREGGNSLSRRVLVAGGGGGEGCCRNLGGAGGGKIAGSGEGSYSREDGGGGAGGTQSQGGSGGAGGANGSYGSGGLGNDGTKGNGGTGGQAGYNVYGMPYQSGGAGGGGGGGYYGGGGGGGGAPPGYGGGGIGGGGGGGSSYVEPRATRAQVWRGWKDATGDGLVVFSWQ